MEYRSKEYFTWLRTLKVGDIVLCYSYGNVEVDSIKHISVQNRIILTEGGLKFRQGCCHILQTNSYLYPFSLSNMPLREKLLDSKQ